MLDSYACYAETKKFSSQLCHV